MKQLAQKITNSSSGNLGLNNTVFGKVKQIRLSSYLDILYIAEAVLMLLVHRRCNIMVITAIITITMVMKTTGIWLLLLPRLISLYIHPDMLLHHHLGVHMAKRPRIRFL
jgi:hypothetical protein